MEPKSKLDRIERALATNNYAGDVTDREIKGVLDDRPIMKMYHRFTGTVLTDAIWSVRGKHRLSGWIDVDRHDGVVRISHRDTDEEIYVGDGSSIGFRKAGNELPPVRTLFLDEVGLTLERKERGLVDLKEVKARYLVRDGIDPSFRMPRTVYGEPVKELSDARRIEDMNWHIEALVRKVIALQDEKTEHIVEIAHLLVENRTLRTEIAALRGTPPEPSDGETLGRAMGAGR